MKILVVVLVSLSFVACTGELDIRARDTGRDIVSPIEAGSSPSGDPPCQPQSRDLSYGKTIPGLWLEELIVDLRVPGRDRASRREVRDTGTALWIDIPAYSRGSIIYSTMITPDTDPDLPQSSTEEKIGHRGSYTLYFERGNFAWESYTASNGTWQLSLLAFPGAGSDTVTWPQGIIDWLHNAVDRAEQSPPQCRGYFP